MEGPSIRCMGILFSYGGAINKMYVYTVLKLRRSPIRCMYILFQYGGGCLVIVVWLFIMMSRVCLQLVIAVFPDHTHLLFMFYNFLMIHYV